MRNVTIALDSPIRVKDSDVHELEMKEPTMAEEEDAMALAVDMGRAQVPLTNEMCMYAMLCRVPYEAIRTMTSADYEKLRRAYNGFVHPIGRRADNENGTPKPNSESSEGAFSESPEVPDGEEAN